MHSIKDHLNDTKEQRRRDAETFKALDGDACMLCGAYGADKRSLFIDCLYAVNEVVPEALDVWDFDLERHKMGYYLRICKVCRGDLLGHLRDWRAERVRMRDIPKDHDGYLIEDEYMDEYIPVRVHGVVRHLTSEQYEEYKKATDD